MVDDAQTDPAAALAALANDVRVRIVRTLGRTETTDPAAIPYREFDSARRAL